MPEKIYSTLLTILIIASSVFAFSAPAAAAPTAGNHPPLTIAVTSNALGPVKKITESFNIEHNARVRIVSGSTGKLFTQITQGAPFDMLIAADEERPRLLEERGLTKKDSRFTYASGVLVIWSPGQDGPLKDDRTLAVLKDPAVRRIAVANPRIAPYGHAAFEALRAEGILEDVRSKFIYGENVSHAFNFARTGNADLALTALPTTHGQGGRRVVIDSALHSPIIQQAVILKDAPDSAAAFAAYLRGPKGRAILKEYGYKLP
ncbi:Molybdenum ABC transporter, substrate-binding protein ModA [hydrothermal vent metagenome]|uniref:Molybdenum ABC transporter, substrate-binding protein ModA n=1 Tax=hydrothermal vent metagenome TaxID=652676 RepID=A0A3B0VBS3_9ZZZZ